MPANQLMSEFVSLAKAVTENPDNYYNKAEMLALMKQVKLLAAAGDKMAQYQLAQLYPKNSLPYLKWMHASAEQGFTNALLALGRDYAEHGKITSIKEAAQYLIKVLASSDSFIKDEASALMERNRLLGAEVQRQMNNKMLGKSAFGLFAREAKPIDREQPEVQNSAAPAA